MARNKAVQRRKVLGNPKTKNLLLLGVGGILAYSYFKGKSASAGQADAGAGVTLSDRLKPVKIGAGEPVTASSYRIIKNRRPGMDYTQAGGQPGQSISFSYPRAATFTRNAVVEGAQVLAEIAS